MRRTLLVVLAAAACGHHDHDEPHGHAPADGDARPDVLVTAWTDRLELFAEFPAFVVGQPSPMAAHLTRLEGHAAVVAGALTITLAQADGSQVEVTAAAPARPGVYAPAPTPTVAGPCTLTARLADEPTLLTSAACVVHAPGAALPEAPDEPPGLISYLKESSWGTGLTTAPLALRPMTPSLRVTGELRATAEREARLTAPAPGRVLAPTAPLHVGMEVTRGQVIATIVPRADAGTSRAALAAEVRAARAEADAAGRERERQARLLTTGAIAPRQLDEATARAEVATARLAAATGQLAQFDAGASGRGGGALQVRAPIAGTLVALDATAGQAVEGGQALAWVVDLGRLWLHADVYEADLGQVLTSTRATFRVDGEARLFEIAPPDGRVVSIGRVVDERTRTVPMIFELANPEGRLRVGSRATVFIETAAAREVPAVPQTAIVRDGGRPIVFVQVDGERFARRQVTLGQRAGDWVEVVAGVALGERVVVVGAYDVKLAGAGGAVPEHGHAH